MELAIRLAIILGVVVALFRSWIWLARNYPLTTMFLIGFLRGLLGRGRRRW